MKLFDNLKITFGLLFILTSFQAKSSNPNRVIIKPLENLSVLQQNNESIIVSAVYELGTYPDFAGLKILQAQLKKNVEFALRGDIPFKIKSNGKDGTVIPFKQGNSLRLEVTLIPCEASERHYFFESAAGIFSYVKSQSDISTIESKTRLAVMDKTRNNFGTATIFELYPNKFELIGFSNLNIKEFGIPYKIIMSFLCGSRPDGFYVLDDEVFVNNSRPINSERIESVIHLPNNQQISVVNNDNINYQQNNTRKPQQNTSLKSYKSEDSHNNSSKYKVESPFYKYLNDSDKTLLSKILNSEMNFDPKGNGSSSFTRCGQKIGKCRWCGKSSSFTTYYNTIGYLIRSANDNIQTPFAFNYQDLGQLIKELKQFLNMIRSGKYYVCQTNSSEMFCSPKCKYEFNYSR